MTSKTEGPGTNTNMDVDYVISYMFGDEGVNDLEICH